MGITKYVEDLLPGDDEGNKLISGVTTGIVTNNWDEKHPGMVQVEIHMGETKKSLTRWVRVMQPYAGKGFGFYMLPEIKSEVLIAFNMGDMNQPYVIGGLWNQKSELPKDAADKDNIIKTIRTQGGNEITFNDKKGSQSIEIKTPKELKITILDESETISVTDKSGENVLTIDSKNGEITLKGKNKITLDAGGKSQIILEKAGTATIKATDINVDAQKALNMKSKQRKDTSTTYEVKANATAKIESGAMLELKGKITKIN